VQDTLCRTLSKTRGKYAVNFNSALCTRRVLSGLQSYFMKVISSKLLSVKKEESTGFFLHMETGLNFLTL
jgi:hypothetical protein